MARLLAAMSGGVDSSVACGLAVRDGHDVVGVTLHQWDDAEEVVRRTKGCSVIDAVADARRAADTMGIAHYTLDFREVFDREVIAPFVSDYARGLTPNPCVRCNELVRFGALLDKARRLGFDGLVTGHYARVAGDRRSGWRLLRARDASKDQSYVLYALGQDALAAAYLPVGEMDCKQQVRELAESMGLPNAGRADSVEVCFVPEGRRPGDVVSEAMPAAVRRGPIVDGSGRVVGEHRGLAHYTIGQRRGLGALGGRRYVARIDPARNAIVVGEPADLESARLRAVRPRFVSGKSPLPGAVVEAVVRYQGAAVPATFTPRADGFALEFHRPVRSVAPGQAVVMYDGDEVLGGGTIAEGT